MLYIFSLITIITLAGVFANGLVDRENQMNTVGSSVSILYGRTGLLSLGKPTQNSILASLLLQSVTTHGGGSLDGNPNIYFVRLDSYSIDPNGSSLISRNYLHGSPDAMIYGMSVAGGICFALLLFFIFIRFPSGMPLAGCCTASIAAACQPRKHLEIIFILLGEYLCIL